VPHLLIELPPGVYNRMTAMNRHGVILEDQSGGPDAGPWMHDLRTGKRTKIPVEPGVFAQALAINDSGDIVGFTGGTAQEQRAVKWSGDPLVATVLATPPEGRPEYDGHCFSKATGINNRGVIVGYVCNTAASAPWPYEKLSVWSSPNAFPEALPPLRPLPFYNLLEIGTLEINDDGMVIGGAVQVSGEERTTAGAVWTAERRLIDLGSVRAFAINAAGVMVGQRYPSTPVRVELR
jgi:uncharacterized membrane protein